MECAMPDEVADKHSGIVVPSPDENASASRTPGMTVVTDWTVVPQMIAAFRFLHDAAIPHHLRVRSFRSLFGSP
jgi:hypothetical protein